jgi:hypothetical protein
MSTSSWSRPASVTAWHAEYAALSQKATPFDPDHGRAAAKSLIGLLGGVAGTMVVTVFTYFFTGHTSLNRLVAACLLATGAAIPLFFANLRARKKSLEATQDPSGKRLWDLTPVTLNPVFEGRLVREGGGRWVAFLATANGVPVLRGDLSGILGRQASVSLTPLFCMMGIFMGLGLGVFLAFPG